MSEVVQPVEPAFSQCLSFGTGVFGLVKIIGNHERDYIDLKTDDSQAIFTTTYNGGAAYSYDATTGEFTSWIAGTKYYTNMVASLNSYPTSIDDIREVFARLRPVEIRFPDRKFYDASKVFLRVGIAKEVLQTGAETDATLRTFDGAFNLSNQTDAVTDITDEQHLETYELPEDVNVNVAIARVNGLRSYLLTDVPLATDTDTGASFEVGMTNEGRIFDYMIIAKASEQGQQ